MPPPRLTGTKAALDAAEPVERRDGAKENPDLQTTVRTQSREAVSHAQGRIRVAVTRNRREKLTALLHHIDINTLRASFLGLQKFAAPGVDVVVRIRGESGSKPCRSQSSDSHRSVSSAGDTRGPRAVGDLYPDCSGIRHLPMLSTMTRAEADAVCAKWA